MAGLGLTALARCPAGGVPTPVRGARREASTMPCSICAAPCPKVDKEDPAAVRWSTRSATPLAPPQVDLRGFVAEIVADQPARAPKRSRCHSAPFRFAAVRVPCDARFCFPTLPASRAIRFMLRACSRVLFQHVPVRGMIQHKSPRAPPTQREREWMCVLVQYDR